MEAESSRNWPGPNEKSPKALWSMARLLSLYDLHREKRDTRSWAHANLIELYLLSLLPDLDGLLKQDEAERLALEHTDQLLGIAGWDFSNATRRVDRCFAISNGTRSLRGPVWTRFGTCRESLRPLSVRGRGAVLEIGDSSIRVGGISNGFSNRAHYKPR